MSFARRGRLCAAAGSSTRPVPCRGRIPASAGSLRPPIPPLRWPVPHSSTRRGRGRVMSFARRGRFCASAGSCRRQFSCRPVSPPPQSFAPWRTGTAISFTRCERGTAISFARGGRGQTISFAGAARTGDPVPDSVRHPFAAATGDASRRPRSAAASPPRLAATPRRPHLSAAPGVASRHRAEAAPAPGGLAVTAPHAAMSENSPP